MNRKKIIIIMIAIVLLIVCITIAFKYNHKSNVALENKTNDKNNLSVEKEKNETSNNQEISSESSKESDELFVIFDKQKKDAEAMKLDLVGTEMVGYQKISKGKIRFNGSNYRYSVNLPIINDTTYSLNGYSTEVILESKYININYEITQKNSIVNPRDINKATVEDWLKKDIQEYSKKDVKFGKELKKYTDVKEENGVIGYARSYIWHGAKDQDSISVTFVKKRFRK